MIYTLFLIPSFSLAAQLVDANTKPKVDKTVFKIRYGAVISLDNLLNVIFQYALSSYIQIFNNEELFKQTLNDF